MIDWEPGDKLICIDADERPRERSPNPCCNFVSVTLRQGGVYTCREVSPAGSTHPFVDYAFTPIDLVDLEEEPAPPFVCGTCGLAYFGYAAARFRKLYRPGDSLVPVAEQELETA